MTRLSITTAIATASLAASLALAGCGIGQSAAPIASGPTPDYTPSAIQGKAMGGLQPIVGATVKIYATQNGSYGANGLLLAEANDQDSGTQGDGYDTDSNGNFTFTSTNYVHGCPAGQYAYIVLSGGNSGASLANPDILLMTMLGPCATLFNVSGNGEVYQPTATIFVNELTTVAAAYALGNFMSVSGPTVNIGAPVSNNFSDGTNAWNGSAYATCSGSACNGNATFNSGSGAETYQGNGLYHAVLNAANLVNIGTGQANATITTNTGGATGTIPVAEVNTIANALQQCVNSSNKNYLAFATGAPASSVTLASAADTLGGTFTITDTPSGGSATPTTVTVTAASTLANAITQINAQDTAVTASSSDGQVNLTITANNSTDTLTYSSSPNELVDTAANSTTCADLFTATPSLTNVTPTNTLQAAMNLDKNPYSSSTNVAALLSFQTAQTQVYTPHLTAAPADWTLNIVYTGGGISSPNSIALDANDNVYALSSNSTLTSITSSGTTNSGSNGFTLKNNAGTPAALAAPQGIALDSLGNLFVANNVAGASSTSLAGVWEYNASTGSYKNLLAHAYGAPSISTDPISFPDWVAVSRRNDVLVSYGVTSGIGNFDWWVCSGGSTCSSYLPDLAVAALTGVTPTTGAIPEPVVSTSGVITSITVNAHGTGYGSAPTVTILGAQPTGGTTASVTANLGSGGSAGEVTSYTVGSGGTGYVPSDTNTYSDGAFTESATSTVNAANLGIMIDPYQNVWFANQGATGTPSTNAGLFVGILANNTPGSQPTFPAYDNSINAGSGIYANKKLGSNTCVTAPYTMAIDSSNNGWVTATTSVPSNTIATPSGSLCKITPVFSTPGDPATVMTGTSEGSAINVGAGMPEGLAIDGNNVLWIPLYSYDLNSTTTFANYGVAAYGTTGTPALVSEPTNGFTGCAITGSNTTCGAGSTSAAVTIGLAINNPNQAAIDSAGSVWLNEPNSSALVQVIGTAAPTVPLLSAAEFGVKP